MAPTATTEFDDEPLTEAEAEGILTAPLEPPVISAPAAPPKRGRGRPPGARNKPKPPGVPGPPPRTRPRSTSRARAAGPTTEQKVLAAWGIPVTVAAVLGSTLRDEAIQADAVALEHYGAAIADAVAPWADASPRFTELLDKLSAGGAPWLKGAMVGLSLASQLAVNHGLVKPSAVASFGAVPREVLLGQKTPDTPPPPPPPAQPMPAPADPSDPWAAGTVPPDWE